MKIKSDQCEICNLKEKDMMHLHHIKEQHEIGTTNSFLNIVCLCSNHHNLLHRSNRLQIIGVFPSTGYNGRTVVYKLDGKLNIDIDEPYLTEKLPQMKLKGKNE